jgi:hypothetical protein
LRFSKKAVVAAFAVTMLSVAASSALATHVDGHEGRRVTICHNTGSNSNPVVRITVDQNALDAHEAHGDTFPGQNNRCPGTDIPEDDDVTICHRDGDDFDLITVDRDELGRHFRHGDRFPNDEGTCEFDDDDDHDHDGDENGCSADHENSSENTIGNSTQSGGLLSLLDLNSIGIQGTSLSLGNNLLCQAEILNDADIAILSGDDGLLDDLELLEDLLGDDSVLGLLGLF